ncbi:MAG: MarR family transcriptional regulator [Rhodospirillales bacterium]|nr:MarR family transcriptional regulator [Rhodospirillales bacterium]
MAQQRARRVEARDYRLLADFRYALRRFLRFSEAAARQAGLTPQQHQLLLAIKGFPGGLQPTVGEIAERLGVRHHSAVELAQRLEEAGLVARAHDEQDRRRVRLRLMPEAEVRLARLSASHLHELRHLRPVLAELVEAIGADS